ncbi:hypothetical protein LJR013_000584 [Pseudarthrobacter oxydans]|uniref:hypothetical protein n=1 Tax=Pseudarthrobacter oxydans TaxID=1671 RepID=UPI003ECF0C66
MHAVPLVAIILVISGAGPSRPADLSPASPYGSTSGGPTWQRRPPSPGILVAWAGELACAYWPHLAGISPGPLEAQANIGFPTIDGSIALLFFGGLPAGFAAAFIYLFIRRWLPPAAGRARAGGVAPPVFEPPWIRFGENIDFAIGAGLAFRGALFRAGRPARRGGGRRGQ